MITAQELKNTSAKLNVTQQQSIEKDWVLGHVLNAIYSEASLAKGLVFKGGTCLRKCWIRGYRFSEDLDFTITNSSLANKQVLVQSFSSVCLETENVGIRCKEIEIKQIWDEYGEETFKLAIPFEAILKPPNPFPKIWIDAGRSEPVILPISTKNIFHDYSDTKQITANVVCYSLEEILAEKLRTVIQRCWPRDIYDVHSILTSQQVDKTKIKGLFLQKCQFKNVAFSTIDNFFDTKRMLNAEMSWQSSLAHLVYPLPTFSEVIKELRIQLTTLFNQ